MDVWIEFKHASKWQAEALFRNFFPSIEDCEFNDIDPTMLDEISLDETSEFISGSPVPASPISNTSA